MAVEIDTSRVSYTGAGTTGPFTIPFYFISNEDVRAITRLIADGTEAELVLTTDFTLTGAGDEGGGELTLTGTLSSAYQLVIFRDPEILQEARFPRNDPFPAATNERVLDLLTMIAQRQAEIGERSIRLTDGDTSGASTTLSTAGNEGKAVRLNADGDAFEFFDGEINTSTFTQSGTGAVERTVAAKLGEIVSVKDFGATGDGTTDDSAAVTAWLTEIAAGAIGYANPGTYIVEACPLLSSTRIIGAGRTQSIFKLKASATTKHILKTTAARTNIAIEGVGFDCNNVADSVALYADRVTGLRVSGCRFTSKYGVYLIGATSDVQVHGNTFDANNYAVIVEPSSTTADVSVVGNTFKNCTNDGVEINCPTGSAKNWAIAGNTFDTLGSNVVAGGFGVGASGGTSYIDGLTIIGNTFYRCDHQAVHIEDGCRNVTVKGNTMLDCGYNSAQTDCAGVYVAATFANRGISNVVVEGNTIKGVADMQYGVFVGGSEPMTGVVVRGNVIEEALTYGILLPSVLTGFTVADNVIYNGAGPAIRQAASKGVVSGNVCFDNQTPKTQTYGIEINTGADVNYIGNMLKDNLTGAFLVTSAGTRNRFIGNVEGANTAITIETENKTMLDATETENGIGVPVKLNATDVLGISGTVNNQAIGVTQVLTVTSAASTPQLTGLVARPGTEIIIVNNSGASFDIMHQNASSTDVNRFILKAGADLTLTSGQARRFFYSAVSRWNET